MTEFECDECGGLERSLEEPFGWSAYVRPHADPELPGMEAYWKCFACGLKDLPPATEGNPWLD